MSIRGAVEDVAKGFSKCSTEEKIGYGLYTIFLPFTMSVGIVKICVSGYHLAKHGYNDTLKPLWSKTERAAGEALEHGHLPGAERSLGDKLAAKGRKVKNKALDKKDDAVARGKKETRETFFDTDKWKGMFKEGVRDFFLVGGEDGDSEMPRRADKFMCAAGFVERYGKQCWLQREGGEGANGHAVLDAFVRDCDNGDACCPSAHGFAKFFGGDGHIFSR